MTYTVWLCGVEAVACDPSATRGPAKTSSVEGFAPPCLHSHGGTGRGSLQRPIFRPRASASRRCSSGSEEYCRYHHAIPSRTNSLLRLRPSGKMTSASVRLYLSFPDTCKVTCCPNARYDVACFARDPNGWFFSGQSIPANRTRSDEPPWRTSIVSPSITPTTFPTTSCASSKLVQKRTGSVTARERHQSNALPPTL